MSYGFFGGSVMTLNIVMYADYFGLAELPRSKGLNTTSWLFGAILGPILLGWTHDTTGSYASGWLVCGGSLFLGGALSALVPKMDQWYPNRCKRPPKDEASRVVKKTSGEAAPPGRKDAQQQQNGATGSP